MENNTSQKYSFFLKSDSDKAVLLIHGITGTPSEMGYLGRKIHKAGYSVMCNTLPRHCSSLAELRKVTWQEIADSCIRSLQQLKNDYRQVFVGGLSMGALMSVHLAYKFPGDVSGIIAFAPTVFFDGWSLGRGKVFMKIGWHIPFLRNIVNVREAWPYGIKDEYLRAHFQRFYKNASASKFDNKVMLFGSPFFPVSSLYQHSLLTKAVEKEISSVKNSILIIHAREDDMASLKNAQFVFDNIGSPDKSLVVLEDSYHMITIDQEKDKVARETVNFLNRLSK
ncbi:MAG: alpha/beta fold hydrolase [Candidatus Omnitrophota bacterium]